MHKGSQKRGSDTRFVPDHLQESGVRVLRDQWLKVAGAFYLVGRAHPARRRFGGDASARCRR